MRLLFIALASICCYTAVWAQQPFTIIVQDSSTAEPLVGVRIQLEGEKQGAITDATGKAVIADLKDGSYTAVITYPGYEEKHVPFSAPSASPLLVHLAEEAVEGHEIIVEATRGNRSISVMPTRVEVLTEEIDEAASMDPSKISHLIAHSTGLQVQYNSATTNSANVRIQGLDGRYAQILTDGFPLYGGFSGGLSIMQIPPLDLRQVEYIKGPASTLYGGGAISGLINLLTKRPTKDESLLHVNVSSLGTTDLNAFFAKRVRNLGITVLASRSYQRAYDPDDDGFTDVPQTLKVNFNPKLFYYFENGVQLYAGAIFTSEDRHGGDMRLIAGEDKTTKQFYEEKNVTQRVTTQVAAEIPAGDNATLNIKNSFTFFNRLLTSVSGPLTKRNTFSGQQVSSFSEASYALSGTDHSVVGGLNLYSQDFNEDLVPTPIRRDEATTTFGGFLQHTWSIMPSLILETGFRGDYEPNYGFFPLPRMSLLAKWSKDFSTRAGFRLGYRLPSIFQQEAEVISFHSIAPITYYDPDPERSIGANLDLSYKTLLSAESFLSVNQLFFFNEVRDPLVLKSLSARPRFDEVFVNANGVTQTHGSETSVKLGIGGVTWFVGYTYTDARNKFDGLDSMMTLTPKHSLKSDVIIVVPDEWRIGVDFEYKSGQLLFSKQTTRDIFMTGLMVERYFNPVVLFINLENITDARQSKYQSMRSKPYNTPQFTEVWAPLDGFFVNGGIKITL